MILVGDCRDVLATLPAGSVQTCVTSPPYFAPSSTRSPAPGPSASSADGTAASTSGVELNPDYATMARGRIALEGRPGGRPAHHQPAAVLAEQLGLLTAD